MWKIEYFCFVQLQSVTCQINYGGMLNWIFIEKIIVIKAPHVTDDAEKKWLFFLFKKIIRGEILVPTSL